MSCLYLEDIWFVFGFYMIPMSILKCCSTIFTFLDNNFTSATAKIFPASTIIMVLLISAESSCHGCVAEEDNRIRRPSLGSEGHRHHRSKVAADTQHMVSPHSLKF